MIKLKSFSVSAINRALQSMWCKICNITGRVETLEIGGGGATPNLQAVTTAGNITSNSIIINNGTVVSSIENYGAFIAQNLSTSQFVEMAIDYFQFVKPGESNKSIVPNHSLNDNLELLMPNGNFSNKTLPISVNGNFANAAGNIVSGENYYNVETLTGGKWIDGKPIYRRVKTGIMSDQAGIAVYGTTSLPDIESLIKFDYYVTAGSATGPINNNENGLKGSISVTIGDISITSIQPDFIGKTVHIIME